MHIPCIYHAYITHSKVSDRGVDWHGNFPYATLLDASKGGLFGWGGAEKSLPNHMEDLTFWFELRCIQPFASNRALLLTEPPPPKQSGISTRAMTRPGG